MKVICNRGALLDGILIASTVVSSRAAKLALHCLKLSAHNNALLISATDTEVTLRYLDNQVSVEQEGELLVPAERLRELVRESTDDTLSIEQAGDTAIIKGADATYKIFTQNPADFPNVPDLQGTAHFSLPAGQLRTLINRTLFAASKEATRYAFNGILMTAKNKKLQMVATDGRRLAHTQTDLTSVKEDTKATRETKGGKDGDELLRAIAPVKTLTLLDKLLTDPEDTVKVQLRGNQLIFQTARATLSSTTIEGQFPPYEEVIPKDSDKVMTAGTADFLSAVRRAAVFTDEQSRSVKLSFSRKGLIISCRSPETGEAEIRFACKYDGDDLDIGFNPHFLMDALRVVDTDEITFEFRGPNRPGLLRGGLDFLYVVMPVNLSN